MSPGTRDSVLTLRRSIRYTRNSPGAGGMGNQALRWGWALVVQSPECEPGLCVGNPGFDSRGSHDSIPLHADFRLRTVDRVKPADPDAATI